MDAQSPANNPLVLALFQVALKEQRPIEVRPDGSFVVLVTTEAHPQAHPQAHPHIPMPRPHHGDVEDGDVPKVDGDGDVMVPTDGDVRPHARPHDGDVMVPMPHESPNGDVPKMRGDVPTGLRDVLALFERYPVLDAPTVRNELGISLKAAQRRLARLEARHQAERQDDKGHFVLALTSRDRVLPPGDQEATDVAQADTSDGEDGEPELNTDTPESFSLLLTTRQGLKSDTSGRGNYQETEDREYREGVEQRARGNAPARSACARVHAREDTSNPSGKVGPQKTLPAAPPQDATIPPEPNPTAERIARLKQLDAQPTRGSPTPSPPAYDDDDDDVDELDEEAYADQEYERELGAEAEDAAALAATRPAAGHSLFDDDDDYPVF